MKKSAKRSNATAAVPTQTPSVNVKKAQGGYVISQYTNKGEKTIVAKSDKEMKTAVEKMLGTGK
ncbi:MAG: hypothetical protein ABSB94_02985 [Syntrophorhabdales bacterium]|jgi:hypothetical protein